MKKNSIKRHIAIILIVLTCIYCIQGLFSFKLNVSHAAAVGYSDDIAGINEALYPGYKALIQSLQNDPKYSNWRFRLYYTGLDWNEVIISECQGHNGSPKSLFQYSSKWRDGDWHCPVCGTRKYDNGSWRCASEAVVAYMMDPRNSINADDIFQFQDISYDNTIDAAAVKVMVTGTFLDRADLIEDILSAGSKKNINPLFIAAKILQEHGNNGSVLSSGNGYKGQYVGVYNYFNAGATGANEEEVIINGLKYAQSSKWTTPEASIIGGISLIADNYVAKGQNTCYFQKFNVINKGSLYGNQYMQNVMGAQTEGEKILNAYTKINKLNGTYTFIIPVYENMPQTVCARPDPNIDFVKKEYDQAKLNVDGTLALRASPSGTVIRHVANGADVTILVRAVTKVGGYYWDKVVAYEKGVGYSGYMAREESNGSKTFLVTQSYGSGTVNGNLNGSNNSFKVEGNNLVVEPNTTINDIKNAGYTIISATDKDGRDVINSNTLGTGTLIKTDKGDFTVVKLGDADGDGIITAVDLLMIKRYIEGKYALQEVYKEAARVNKEAEVTAVDLLRVKRHLEGKTYITL